jgi:hypothetical protein
MKIVKQTVVEWLVENLHLHNDVYFVTKDKRKIIEQAKEMEKTNTDNKVIHFAEWITKKHTTVLMTLYEQFEEQYYNETFNTKEK